MDLSRIAPRLDAVIRARLDAHSDRLDALERTRRTLGYQATLSRGYAVVRAGKAVITAAAEAEAAQALEIEFRDGRVQARTGKGGAAAKPSDQGSLF